MDELKPCPFCGKSDLHITNAGLMIQCHYCGGTITEYSAEKAARA